MTDFVPHEAHYSTSTIGYSVAESDTVITHSKKGVLEKHSELLTHVGTGIVLLSVPTIYFTRTIQRKWSIFKFGNPVTRSATHCTC